MKIIVIGAGWAGVSAAYEARKLGADVTLIEKTDMLLGTGLVGGIMRNNARYTALEELKYMGAHEFVKLIDNTCIHKNIDFPGHKHASLYDVTKIENIIKNKLLDIGVNIVTKERITKLNLDNKKIISVESKNNIYNGDVFIDATGSAGPMNNCVKYGNGCAMCILRCPTFGSRVSITKLCRIEELIGKTNKDELGSMSGSCKILKESLSNDLVNKLEEKGKLIIPLDNKNIEDHLNIKACQQYALKEFKDNLILLDTGCVKMMSPYYSLDKLRSIKGFENARYLDPYSGGNGNSMRFFAIAPHDTTLKVKGVDNLFCAGEKVFLVGHTEAIMTGFLAGYNAVKLINNSELLVISRETCIGEAIAFSNEMLNAIDGLKYKYTLSGSVLFERIKKLNLYTIDSVKIKNKIKKLKIENIFLKI